jgi:hypothetical protein
MTLEDLILNIVIEDGIDYNYLEVDDSLLAKYELEEMIKNSKGYWKVKYSDDSYSYIKDGRTIKQIADNRVYHVIQVVAKLFDVFTIHREYELTKDYEYSQIEYWMDEPIWAIAHLFYFKNGQRHNDLGYAHGRLYLAQDYQMLV